MKNYPLLPVLMICVSFVFFTNSAIAQSDLNIKSIKNERLLSILSLPVGLDIAHSPNPVYAVPNSDLKFRYIWHYTTTVTPKIEGLTVIEFGGFLFKDGSWRFSNDTGKAFGPQDFVKWYSTPANGVLLAGKNYADPKNRVVASKLQGQKGLWYFIAQGADGKKYNGYSLVECMPRLQEAKATPPSKSSPKGNE